MLEWKDEYNIGIDEIDKDHHHFVTSVGKIKAMIDRNDIENVLKKAFPELISYSKRHFELEEELMQQIEFPSYMYHHRQHRLFIEQVNNLIHAIKSKHLEAILPLYNFVVEWTMSHILFDDMKFGEYYQKHSNNES